VSNALATILASLGGAGAVTLGLCAYFGKILEKNIEEKQKSESKKNIELLKAQLAVFNEEVTGQNKARRDYRYEAKKRLYAQVEPLLFQLTEAGESALYRIYSLARATRNGNLDGEYGWLDGTGYYMASTIYKLIAPLVIVRILKRKLTLVDLTVDPRINLQYQISKWIYNSYGDDFQLARGGVDEGQSNELALEYYPHDSNWEAKRNNEPEKFWRQGIPIGYVDNATEVLLEEGKDGTLNLISFGAFWEGLTSASKIQEKFSIFLDVFVRFHPRRRPILWRLLVAQARLFHALLQIRDAQSDGPDLMTREIFKMPIEKASLFNWATNQEDRIAIQRADTVATLYLDTCVRDSVRLFHADAPLDGSQ
jgi:hypothetical protein